MRMVVYKFRQKTTWGIYVSLSAVAQMDRAMGSPQVAPGLELDLTKAQLAGLLVVAAQRGVDIMSVAFSKRYPDMRAVIAVQSADFSLSDFQDEGLTAVVAIWIAEEFELPPPTFTVEYSVLDGKYMFDFET